MTTSSTRSTPPEFVAPLFGYRVRRDGTVSEVPNCADSDNNPSINIARAMLDQLGVAVGTPGPTDPGAALEIGVENWLRSLLPTVAPARAWTVERHRSVTAFVQYEHLARLQAIIDTDDTRTLRAEIGSDYLIAPDVTVGLSIAIGDLLHASVSCKWTIRSDRVQNIRHEAVILTRHRRGRQPHIVAVTAEPLPTRIAAIARGTGEVDAVYHVALDSLVEAALLHGSTEQRQVLDELVGQRRLFDLTILPETIAD